jgi:hypothetical protein
MAVMLGTAHEFYLSRSWHNKSAMMISQPAAVAGRPAFHRPAQPIPEARVLISTAQVREGFSPLCPSCYSDCGKEATTDSDGHFTIANVDDALLFNVLIAARS